MAGDAGGRTRHALAAMSSQSETTGSDVCILIHDGECELCRTLARWVQRRDPRGRLRTMTFDDPAAPVLLEPLPREQWRNTFHVVLPDRTLRSGDAALPVLARLMRGGAWLAWLMELPWLGRGVTGIVYRRLAQQHEGG